MRRLNRSLPEAALDDAYTALTRERGAIDPIRANAEGSRADPQRRVGRGVRLPRDDPGAGARVGRRRGAGGPSLRQRDAPSKRLKLPLSQFHQRLLERVRPLGSFVAASPGFGSTERRAHANRPDRPAGRVCSAPPLRGDRARRRLADRRAGRGRARRDAVRERRLGDRRPPRPPATRLRLDPAHQGPVAASHRDARRGARDGGTSSTSSTFTSICWTFRCSAIRRPHRDHAARPPRHSRDAADLLDSRARRSFRSR